MRTSSTWTYIHEGLPWDEPASASWNYVRQGLPWGDERNGSSWS